MLQIVLQRALACTIALAAIAGCSKQTAMLQAPTPHQATSLPTGAFSAPLNAPANVKLPSYHTEALAMFPHLLGAAFPDASAPINAQNYAALAYNSHDNTYMVVWQDSAANGQLWARIKDAHGTQQVADFQIPTNGSIDDYPKVTYIAHLNQFAVVYTLHVGGLNEDVYLQRMSASGAMIGAPVPVSTAPSYQSEPDLAYDPINQRVEVVWSDTRDGFNSDIYGRLLAFNGNQTLFLTNETLVGNSAPDPNHGYQEASQFNPTIAFGSAQQRYVVAWTDARNDFDADTPSSNGNGYDIYGSVLGANGIPMGGNFPISTLAEDQYEPSIAYLAVSDKFLLVFDSDNNGFSDEDLLGAGLDGDGSVLGSGTISNQYGQQYEPSVAGNDTSMTWLVAFTEDIPMPPTQNYTVHVNGRHIGWAFQLGDIFAVTRNNTSVDERPAVAANTADQEFLVDYTNNGAVHQIWGQRVDRGY